MQLLLRSHPDWRDHPVVVVQDDRPQGVVLWANLSARSMRVLPGMTFAAARSLASGLHASVVPPAEIEAAVESLVQRLLQFTPRVEPLASEPGVFFLDPAGLVPLYGSLEAWAETVQRHLEAHGFTASVVVGFHRYRTYALARAGRRASPWVLCDPHRERAMAAAVPLAHLAIDPDLRDHLRVLGVHTLGEFLRLPQAQLRTRFGEEATRLYALASQEWAPLQPRVVVEPIKAHLQLEPPDADHTRLLFGLKSTLHDLMNRLAARSQALTALHLCLELDHAPAHHESLEPARPTLDVPLVVDLVRLRLASLRLPAAIEAVGLELEGTLATAEQLALFRTQTRRDLEAAGRAVARLRASLGPEAVTRARLRSAHLPEACFEWEPLQSVSFPQPKPLEEPPPLCRRVLPRPVPLPPRPRHEPEAWLGHRGAVRSLFGPYRISGGWWVRTVERDYYYAETQCGEVLWIYYDRPRRRWFFHGTLD